MANWLNFNMVSELHGDCYPGYQYDSISDAVIADALVDTQVINNIDTGIDWQDDRWLSVLTTVPESRKHAYRVAALVRELQLGGKLKSAISLDTFSNVHCCNSISDGHHRVRALQYLDMASGPFSLSGELDVLEDMVAIAGAVCPTNCASMFSPSLLVTNHDDIVLTAGAF